MNISQIAGKMKTQNGIFSGILSRGLPKKTRKFVAEMLFGLQVNQSVRLTQIGRALNEEISIKKTQERLCRQLNREGLGQRLIQNLLKEGNARVGKDTLKILDISDITKKYAKKMQYLAQVRDGSEGKITQGYWTVQVIAAELDQMRITPLYDQLYSQKAPDFESENDEILKGIDAVDEHTEGRGIWVMDRGADRIKLLAPLLQRSRRFIVRCVGNRHLVYRGNTIVAEELARSCEMLHAERLTKEENMKEKSYWIEFGFLKVKLPEHDGSLNLVVVRGFGSEPMMLLTNVEVTTSRQSLLKIVLSYVRRWQIEDTIRFAKQTYQLEDIRLLSYRRLQNMMALVLLSMYFVCVWMGDRLRLGVLAHHLLRAAKRLFGIPDFRYYAIADGIKDIFACCRSHSDPPSSKPPDPQLQLAIA